MMESVSFRFAIMQEIKSRLETLDANGKWGENAEGDPVFLKVIADERRSEWRQEDVGVLIFGDDAARVPVLGGQTQALLVNRNPSSRNVDGMDLGPSNTKAGHTEFPIRFNWYVEPMYPAPGEETAQMAYDWLWHLQRFFSCERAKRNDPDGILGFKTRSPCINGLEFSRGVVEPRDSEQFGWIGWLNVVLTLVEDFNSTYRQQEK